MRNIPEVRFIYNNNGKKMANCFILYMEDKRYFFSYETCMFSMQYERNILYITKLCNYHSVTTSKQMNNMFKALHIPFTAKEYYDHNEEVIAVNLCKRDE